MHVLWCAEHTTKNSLFLGCAKQKIAHGVRSTPIKYIVYFGGVLSTPQKSSLFWGELSTPNNKVGKSA